MFSFFLRSQDIVIEELAVQSAIGFLCMAGLLRLSLFFKAFTFESGYAFMAEYFISCYPFDGKMQIKGKVLVVWQNN